jgi:DOMON domain
MPHFFHFGLLFSLVFTVHCKAQTVHNMNQTTQNGMTVKWEIQDDHLLVTMTAPTEGWVAIGFNTREGLAGTNLIMGCVKNGVAILSDRHTLAPGNHKSIGELGSVEATQLIVGTETKGVTSLTFTLPLMARDEWHHTLVAGKTYHLLMAFSREDDFSHHSMMRTAVEISL